MKVDIAGLMNRARSVGGGTDRVATQPKGESTMVSNNPLGKIHILGTRSGNRRE